MLTAALLSSLHPVAHRFVTPDVVDQLMDVVYDYIDLTQYDDNLKRNDVTDGAIDDTRFNSKLT